MVTTSGQNVELWIEEMEQMTSSFVEDFQDRNGYPPGEHYVLRSTQAEACNVLAEIATEEKMCEFIEFYSRVERISMPDVGSGFFVDSAEDVVKGMHGPQPTKVLGACERRVAVFGSEGGGALFAVDRQTGEVVRLDGGALLGDIYDTGEQEAELVSPSFQGFLQFLRRELNNALIQ
jgi:hypothetical protein